MKLVIEISEDDYRKVQDGRASVSMMRGAIRNSTPHETVTEFADRCRECGREKVLDKIRAEIEQTAKDYDEFADYRRVYGLWIAIDIIDKYRVKREG